MLTIIAIRVGVLSPRFVSILSILSIRICTLLLILKLVSILPILSIRTVDATLTRFSVRVTVDVTSLVGDRGVAHGATSLCLVPHPRRIRIPSPVIEKKKHLGHVIKKINMEKSVVLNTNFMEK